LPARVAVVARDIIAIAGQRGATDEVPSPSSSHAHMHAPTTPCVHSATRRGPRPPRRHACLSDAMPRPHGVMPRRRHAPTAPRPHDAPTTPCTRGAMPVRRHATRPQRHAPTTPCILCIHSAKPPSCSERATQGLEARLAAGHNSERGVHVWQVRLVACVESTIATAEEHWRQGGVA
jgi:hypothetical protein